MRYKVKRIMEPDYGCEERPENYVDMDKVILCDENGSELCIEVADEELYEKEINVGDLVTLDPGNEIRKAEIHEENIENKVKSSVPERSVTVPGTGRFRRRRSCRERP